ncbi:TPA: prepilin peptidase-dependent protein [Citrobacter freundii]
MLMNARGFSLLEVLIAMALSSMLLLSAASFLPSLQRVQLYGTQRLALEDEIWQCLYTVAKHLQRAGYCLGDCAGKGLVIAESGECVIVQWDANNNGLWDTVPQKDAEQTGFRLHNQTLETLRGAASCTDAGWDKMTDPDSIAIEAFHVERRNQPGFAPQLTLRLRGSSKKQPGIAVEAQYSVTGFNL